MNTYRIQRVAKLTGLSRDVIRVWERRYGLIKPLRGANRYRIYTDEDVALLRYLRIETEKGQTIGDLAAIGRDMLLARMRESSVLHWAEGAGYGRILEELVAALDPLNRELFERRLNGAVAVIPFEEALSGILLPLQERVGQLWHDGKLDVAVEHYVTKQVQQKLFFAMNHLPVVEEGPKVIVGCVRGELHEIGAQTVAYRCRIQGCRVYYLGADVPVPDLAALVHRVEPAFVLLSCVTIPDAEQTRALARELREAVTGLCPVVLGGAGALAHREIFVNNRILVWDGRSNVVPYLAGLQPVSTSR